MKTFQLCDINDLPVGLPGKKNVRNETGETGASGKLTVAKSDLKDK
jgi:hypothetical protein